MNGHRPLKHRQNSFQQTAKQRWVKYINVFKTINRLKKAQAKTIENPDDIVKEI